MREGGYLRSATGIQIHAGPTQIGKFVRFVRSRLAVEANCSNLSSIGRSDVWHCTPFTTSPPIPCELRCVKSWGIKRVSMICHDIADPCHKNFATTKDFLGLTWSKEMNFPPSLFYFFHQLAFDTSLLWEVFLTTRFKKSMALYIFKGKLAIKLRESENRFDKHWVIKILAPQ